MLKIKKILQRRLTKPLYISLSRIFVKLFPCKYYNLFESDYNCGTVKARMTERCLEVPLGRQFLEKLHSENADRIVEVGAVFPYYYPGEIKDVIDPTDTHELVNHHISMMDYDFTDASVLSISTIEHIGRGDYNIQSDESAEQAIDKLMSETKHCLATWAGGDNRRLDSHILEKYKDNMTLYRRGYFDNNWRIESDKEKLRNAVYSDLRWADYLVVVEK